MRWVLLSLGLLMAAAGCSNGRTQTVAPSGCSGPAQQRTDRGVEVIGSEPIYYLFYESAVRPVGDLREVVVRFRRPPRRTQHYQKVAISIIPRYVGTLDIGIGRVGEGPGRPAIRGPRSYGPAMHEKVGTDPRSDHTTTLRVPGDGCFELTARGPGFVVRQRFVADTVSGV